MKSEKTSPAEGETKVAAGDTNVPKSGTARPKRGTSRRTRATKTPVPKGSTKLSVAAVRRIIKALECGATWRLAASAGGVDEDTLLRHRRLDSGFAETLARARDKGAIESLGIIRDAARKGDWRAARERLTLAFPEEFGKNRHEFSGPGGAPIPVQLEGEQTVKVTVDLADAVGRDPDAIDAFLAYLGRRVGDRARPSESRVDAEVGDQGRS